jgi:putative CocE/NonD family hydrolase
VSKGVDVELRWDVKVPLRDGAQLGALLYLPQQHRERSPAIAALTPYIAQSHHVHAAHFASCGYAFLSVDTRGRGNSDGKFHPLNAALDGHDVVEWLARQPFCDGNVAMWGSSYLAYCQWATAAQRPPHLKTIVPVSAPFYGVDVPFRSNIFESYTVRWLGILWGRALQDKVFADQPFWRRRFQQWLEEGVPFGELDDYVGMSSVLFREWVSHPHQDRYWDSYNPTPQQYAQLEIPILTITGAYDSDQLGALEHYRQHTRRVPGAACAPHYLVIGPWDHAGTSVPKTEFCGIKVGPESLVDLRQLQVDWYRWTMGDGARPAFLKRNVAYYVIGSEKWRYADSIEGVTVHCEPLYLRSLNNATDLLGSGCLTADSSRSELPDHYRYDPRDVSVAQIESTVDRHDLVDQSVVNAMAGRCLVYHGLPFDEDVEISGFFRLRVWIAIDQPDADFEATVYEVAADGTVTRLTADWMRARYRESLRESQLIDTTEPLRYDFERFMFVSRRIRKGCRLRLIVGSINSIHKQKNYNCGREVSAQSMADARTVTVKLFHDEKCPSALYVPYGSPDEP